MSVLIKRVVDLSPAKMANISAGEKLLSINGNVIVDVLDYRFYQVNDTLRVKVENENGKIREVLIKKDEYEELGLEFDTYLMDRQRHCKNKCIFCFIDQLPRNLRKSLYFKDDDSRLSFLFGNYITLTNLTEHEIERIIKLHISPINISVHTMDKALRCEMMGNKNAGKALDVLYKFAENNIKINCQIVVCPGINDRDSLKSTLNELIKLYPSVSNIAVVPVGLTRFRQNLYPITPFDREKALETLNIVENIADKCYQKFKERIVFCSDEIYLKANSPIPNSDFYGDFAQLENGVGLISLLRSEFLDELEYGEHELHKKRKLSIATGKSAFPFIKDLAKKAMAQFENLECNVICIKNDFFGENITVSGLITGSDLTKQIKALDLGEELLISSAMLKSGEDIFLDDMTLSNVEKILKIKVTPVNNNGEELLKSMLGCER